MSVTNGEKANAANFNSSFVSKEIDSTVVSKVSLVRALSGADVTDVQSDINDNKDHVAGDGSDHADVATNTTHSTGDGSDHSAVAANTTHTTDTANPHSVTITQAVTADAGTDISAAELETLSDGSNADALHVHAGGGGQTLYDRIVPTDSATLTAALAAAAAGDSIWLRTQVTVEDPTISVQHSVDGTGFNSQITGDLTISANNVTIKGLYIKGSIIIDSGVQGTHILNCFFDDPLNDVIDNSGNSDNWGANNQKAY